MKTLLSIALCLALTFTGFAQESASIIRTNAGAPSNGTNEVQTLTIGGSTTGGTFKLTFDGFTTASITWSGTTGTLLANINTALDALANLADGEVVATDSTLSSGNGALLLTFSGNRAKLNVSQMTLTNALTGGTHTLAIATTTAGVDATHRDAPLGALLVNTTNKTLYQNRGTSLNPTWTEIVGIAVTDSASVAALVSDETGTSLLVFNTNPVIVGQVVTTGLTASGSASNNFGSSTGAFVTSSGANTLSGDATVAAGKDLSFAAGDGAADFSLGTGLFKSTTGANTLSGDVSIAAGKDVVFAAGDGILDASLGTGITKTTTGLNTLGGLTSFKSLTTAVAAAGSTVADAAQLGAQNVVHITSGGATLGVKLGTGVLGQIVDIINDSATAAELYAASGGTVNGLAPDASIVIPASKGVRCFCTAADTWIVFDLPAKAAAS